MLTKTLKKYNILVNQDIEYSRANMSLEECKQKHPDHVAILEKGTILWSQEEPLNIEQIVEAKTCGVRYQFGFGPAYFMVPFDKLTFIKTETLFV